MLSDKKAFQKAFSFAKDHQQFAQLLTFLERNGAASFKKLPWLLKSSKKALRVGITGPPGAGKSTLIDGLIEQLRARDLSVGVLAIDPSSPFSQGAILGDRIRFNRFVDDKKVFIRSLGSRGSLGGLSSSAWLLVRAFDACDFDVLLLETVGVGQTELEIMNVADLIGVVLVPESGDSIQAMKAGLLEIADFFIVNKSDRPGSESFVRELEHAFQLLDDQKEISIFKTVATEKSGLEKIVKFIEAHKKTSIKPRNNSARLKMEAKALLRAQHENLLSKKVEKLSSILDFQKLIK